MTALQALGTIVAYSAPWGLLAFGIWLTFKPMLIKMGNRE